MFGDTLVHTFITPADQEPADGSRAYRLAVSWVNRRPAADIRTIAQSGPAGKRGSWGIPHATPQQFFDRLKQRFRLQDHAFATAKRTVIDRAVLVFW